MTLATQALLIGLALWIVVCALTARQDHRRLERALEVQHDEFWLTDAPDDLFVWDRAA